MEEAILVATGQFCCLLNYTGTPPVMHNIRNNTTVHALVGTLLLAAAPVESARGAILISITESGSDLIVTTTGSADIGLFPVRDLSLGSTANFSAQSNQFVAFGAGLTQDTWLGSSVPGWSFVDGGLASKGIQLNAPVVSLVSGGADFGFRPDGVLYLPGNYVSGSTVDQVLRVSGESFSSLNLSPGESAIYSWDTATGRDSITMVVVPEPSHALLVLVGSISMAMRRRRA